MNKEIKKLTWKHFWQQKIEELIPLGIFLLVLMSATSLMIIICYICFLFGVEGAITINPWLIGISIAYLSILIIHYFIKWIKSNWEMAEERATEDLKRRIKGGKEK